MEEKDFQRFMKNLNKASDRIAALFPGDYVITIIAGGPGTPNEGKPPIIGTNLEEETDVLEILQMAVKAKKADIKRLKRH